MLYGEVIHQQGFWAIRAEPHVRAKLKRVFPRAPQEAGDWIRITDSPENSRDLEWFLLRYPMDVKGQLQLIGAAALHRDQEMRVAELLAKSVPTVNYALAEPLREYQGEAVQLLEVVKGLLLADQVGLGKTVTAIGGTLLPRALPAVVVVEAHLLHQWRRFFKRFAPTLRLHVIKTGEAQATLKKLGRYGTLPDVYIISYFRLRTWADVLAEIVRYAIFDEVQRLRNAGSGIYTASSHLASRAEYKIGLSATPIYNYGSEFYWVIDALRPGVLGSREEFLREWSSTSNGGIKARIKDPEQFGAYLRREGIMLRRLRKDPNVRRELPPITTIVHEIDADETTLHDLGSDALKLAQIIVAHNEQFRGQKMQAAGEFDAMMRQATGVAKAPYVAQFVRMLLEQGEKVVLFGWHRAVYEIWREALKDFHPLFYTGTETAKRKDKAVEMFCDGTVYNLLIMSLRAGAGTDGIQEVCRIGVVGEFDWSAGVHEQCIGRLDRDGQPEPVSAYFMYWNGGADPVMAEVVGIKREQSEGVLNPDRELVERIDNGGANVQLLARDFLKRRGVAVPPAAELQQLQIEEQPA